MPVFTFTARVLDQAGEVVAVKQAPFFVLGDDAEDIWDIAERLEKAARDLEEIAADLEAARGDERHRRHHWWVP